MGISYAAGPWLHAEKLMLFAIFLLESFAFFFGCLHPLKEWLLLLGFLSV